MWCEKVNILTLAVTDQLQNPVYTFNVSDAEHYSWVAQKFIDLFLHPTSA